MTVSGIRIEVVDEPGGVLLAVEETRAFASGPSRARLTVAQAFEVARMIDKAAEDVAEAMNTAEEQATRKAG